MTGANVARAMQLSAPTVHEMVGRLERDGYITRAADKSISFTDRGARARRDGRPPPPADRALPDRRAEDPVGRRARGGRAARARDVAGPRGAHAGRDRGREDVPARPPDRAGHADRGRPARATPSRARRSPSCASRTRPRTCCTCSSARAWSPGARATVASVDDEHITVDFDGDDRDAHPLRRRDRLACWPTRRRRRASRSPSSSCSAKSATAASNRADNAMRLGMPGAGVPQ